MRHRHHGENHRTQRIGWLRAAVLGANDGIRNRGPGPRGLTFTGRYTPVGTAALIIFLT